MIEFDILHLIKMKELDIHKFENNFRVWRNFFFVYKTIIFANKRLVGTILCKRKSHLKQNQLEIAQRFFFQKFQKKNQKKTFADFAKLK